MHPRDIAKWITEDLEVGRKGVIAEMLFGQMVNPGQSPIDVFINSADVNYLDFDPNNKKFQQAAIKMFGAYPDEQQWTELIKNSSQSKELKSIILDVLVGDDPSQETGSKFTVELVNGNNIKCDYVKEGITRRGTKFLWIGIGPTENGYVSKETWIYSNKYIKQRNPELFVMLAAGRWKWKFVKIMTIKLDKISAIVKQKAVEED